MRDANHSYVCHDSLVCCGITFCRNFGRHPWHDSFIYATWFIPMCDMTHYVCHDSLICGGIIDCRNFGRHPWHMIHSYMRHDSCVCVTWLIIMCAMTHPYVCQNSLICCEFIDSWNACYHLWCDAFICATWLVHVCAMTRSYVWHDSFMCNAQTQGILVGILHTPQHILQHTATHAATHMQCIGFRNFCRHLRTDESCHTYEWVMSHVWMSQVAHMNKTCHISISRSNIKIIHTYK